MESSLDIPNILEKNRELNKLHAGKRCFIIGSGPSIKDQDLLLLKDEIKIVSTHFYKHEKCKDIGPDYWVCADPAIWKEQDLFLKPLLNAIEEYEINTKLFFPIFGMVTIERGVYLNLHYYLYDFSKDIDEDIDFTTGIPPYGQNIALVALMLALYLGCNPIYLIGFEHTWWSWKRENYANAENPNYYKPFFSPMSQRERFDWVKSTIYVQKFQYFQLIKYAEKRGTQIYNATEGGYLDLFPRAKYEDLFPAGNRSIDTKNLLSTIPDIASVLGRSAIKLVNEGEHSSALVLLDEAISQNVGKRSKVEGLDYLRSICLMGLGEHHEAIKSARQDYLCNSSNRENSLAILQALGDEEFRENGEST